ncbi:MAG: hypothetical protein A2Y79_07625 [Deltaproteobacteria bacterium RBG_13_43_22]|nr:MAG: hypothetical protein A2Y79_07625 [Deltaproteobacteria bacterium RBG_13_43_22]
MNFSNFLWALFIGGSYFWNCPKGNYEFPIRPKGKVDFDTAITPKPVSCSGEDLLEMKGSSLGPVIRFWLANGQLQKQDPPMILV